MAIYKALAINPALGGIKKTDPLTENNEAAFYPAILPE